MIFRIRRILTTEQHVKLQKLFEQNEKDRRGKGHGRVGRGFFLPDSSQ